MKWTIYDKSGKPKHESITEFNGDGGVVYQDTIEYSGTWMGECFLTVSIKSAYPIDFQIGDYIDYRGERFTINYDPTVIKAARRGTYGEGFTYDSIKFNSYSNELTQIMFHDWVLYDNNLHYTSLPEFSFYSKDVDDLADRLQANTDRWCKANGRQPEEYWMFYTLKNNTAGTADSGQLQSYYERTVKRAKDIMYSCGVADTDEAYTTFISAIEAKWKEAYYVNDAYADSRDDERYDRTITASTQSVWDLMEAIKQQFGLNFIIRGRNVFIGTHGIPTAHLFQYGKDNGLYEIDKTADQDQKVVTKLHAYGGNDNLPTRYYADLNMTAYVKVTAITSVNKGELQGDTPSVTFTTDVKYQSRYFTALVDGSDSIYEAKLLIDGCEAVNARILPKASEDYIRILSDSDTTGNGDDKMLPFINALKVGTQVSIIRGIKKDAWPVDHLTAATENLPDNMAVNYLMLPGFPNYSLKDICHSEYDEDKGKTNYYITSPYTSKEVLFHSEDGKHLITFSADKYDPYLLSPNADTLGVKEGDIFCNEDNDDNGLKKVYPSIEEMTDTDAGTGSAGVRLDAVVKADTIEDNGVWPNNKKTEVPGFHIWLPELGFDLREAARQAGGSSMEISMKNGFCGGRTFSVAQATQEEDKTWKLDCSRVQDTSLDLWYPYSYAAAVKEPGTDMANAYQILPGDNYVITGISVSEVNYVWAASVKLLRKAIHWLCKNDYTRYVYTPKIDEIYMARQHELSLNDTTGATKSLHDTLKEGDLLMFADDDLGLNGSVYIQQLTIKENGNNGIATYEVTLRNEVTVGTLERVQNAVDSLKNDISNGNVGGVLTPTDIDALTSAYGEKYFLSKLHTDTAAARITFAEGLTADGAVTANAGVTTDDVHSQAYSENAGYHLWITDGAANMILDNLTVRGKWVARILEVLKLQYSEGNRLLGCAGCTLAYVEKYDSSDTLIADSDTTTAVSYYRCYFRASDGEQRITNTWHKGDYAWCQTFNLTDGTYENASNRLYQRLVVGVSEKAVTVGTQEYHYIDLSNEQNVLVDDDTLTPAISQRPCKGYLYYTNADTGVVTELNDAPQADDQIAQVGNAYDTSRQGAIQLIVTGGSPAICIYNGINQPTQALDNFCTHKLSPAGSWIDSSSITFKTAVHQSNPYVECGDWTENTTAYTNEVYHYGGSTWVCLQDNTTSAPNTEDGSWKLFAEKGKDAASKRYLLVPNIGSIRRNKHGITTVQPNAVSTRLVYYGGKVIALSESRTTLLADRRKPAEQTADFYAKSYLFVDAVDTKDSTATVTIEQRDSRGNTIKSTTTAKGTDTATLAFSDIDDKADSLEVTYNSEGAPAAARTVPIIYDGTDGEDGQDGEAYTVSPAQIIITEHVNSDWMDKDNLKLNTDVGFTYQVEPDTFKIFHNSGGKSEEVEYSKFQCVSPMCGGTEPEWDAEHKCYKISSGHGFTESGLKSDMTGSRYDPNCFIYHMSVDGHVVELPVYVNRIGSMVSRTVGDATVTLRDRTYTWIDKDGKAHTGTVESFVKDTADQFDRTMTAINTAEGEMKSEIEQTASEINLSVTNITNGLKNTGISITDGTITAQGDRFKWYSTSGEEVITFDGSGNATFKGHVAATSISTNSNKFYVKDDGSMHAEEADISGKITTNEGEIGGIGITSSGLETKDASWRMIIRSNYSNTFTHWGWKDLALAESYGYLQIYAKPSAHEYASLKTNRKIQAYGGIEQNVVNITAKGDYYVYPGTSLVVVSGVTDKNSVTINIRLEAGRQNTRRIWAKGQPLHIFNNTNTRILVDTNPGAQFYPGTNTNFANNDRAGGNKFTIREWNSVILNYDGSSFFLTGWHEG